MTKGHCRGCIGFEPGIDGTGWCKRHRAKYRAMGTCEKYAPIYDERHGRPAQDQPKTTQKAKARST